VSIDPQAVAATPVGQVTAQVTTVSVVPLTNGVKVWVVLVITLGDRGRDRHGNRGWTAAPAQPRAPRPSARVKIEQSFHGLMPVLPRTLNIRSAIGPRFVPTPKIATPSRVLYLTYSECLLTVNRNVRMGSKKFVFCGLLYKLRAHSARAK